MRPASPKLLLLFGLVTSCVPHPVEPATSAVPLAEGGSALFDDPAAARGWYLRARAAEARGDLAAADRAMGWVVRRGRGFVTTWQQVGDYRLRRGRAADAIDAYYQGLAIDPDHGPTHHGLARAWLEVGQLDEVEAHLAQAAAAGRDVLSVRVELARRRGDARRARHLLRQALPPSTPSAVLARADLAATLGDAQLVWRLLAPLRDHPVHGAVVEEKLAAAGVDPAAEAALEPGRGP